MSEDLGDVTGEDKEKKPLLHKVKIGAVIAAIVIILIVVFQNTEEVETKFLFVEFTMPRAALLILTFLLGGAAGVLIAFLRPWRKKKDKEEA